MRLKNSEGPLAIHNGNNDILNSPKRINTIQNSNITANYNSSTNNTTTTNNYTYSYDNSIVSNFTTTDVISNVENLSIADLNVLNQVVHDKVQWCNSSQEVQNRTLYNNNANNRNNQLVNINNTLAATIRQVRHGTASSIYTESSPDDSLLDFEEAQPSCSSTDTSPQDEDRAFDLSDSESSEDGNLSNRGTLQRRGITNPNYPGFQHFAYSLNFRSTPEADLTDDDIECDTFTTKFQEEANNNNIDETDYKIDSVNRLDSVENIQKVFYDKTVFPVEEECEFNQISESSSSASNHSDEDVESSIDLNINIREKADAYEDIVGDLSKEIESELCNITLTQSNENQESSNPLKIVNAEVKELEEAVENLQVMKDLQSPVTKYNIEPNIENNFDKQFPGKQLQLHQIYEDSIIVKNIPHDMNLKMEAKIVDAFLSNAKENISPHIVKDKNFVEIPDMKMEFELSSSKPELHRKDSNRETEDSENHLKKMKLNPQKTEMVENHCKESRFKEETDKEDDNVVPRKKEKVDIPLRKRKDHNQQVGSWITVPRRELTNRNKDMSNRRSVPMVKEKKKTSSSELLGGFDVYNIETAMPKIDLEAIECHLRAAHEEDRRRRTDREEIRRRLAMGCEDDYFTDRPGRKPSLQARLQSGMNLQICFMNESLSDTDSPSSDSECPMTNPKQPKTTSPKNNTSLSTYPDKPSSVPAARPATLSLGQPLLQPTKEPQTETDFFTRQARLQTEARMALAQAKEMARMQMEIERQRQKKSPITEMIRNSLEKVGIPFPEEKRRLSRQLLTEMNVAQLQVIVNDLHTQIETLNENLVKFLMDRDDLHMEQDSMLVDIEDLTRYLGAKEQVLKDQNIGCIKLNNNTTPPSPAPSSPLSVLNTSVKPHLNRIASLVKK